MPVKTNQPYSPRVIKIASGIFALLFFTFAAVQYNDSDSISWIFLYAYVGVMAAMAVFGKYNLALLVPIITIFALYFIYLTPSIIEWIASDDSLIGGMSDDKMYIERSREAFGLLLGLAALLFIFFTRPR